MTNAESAPVVNAARLAEVTGGDREFETVLLGAFLEDSADQLAEIKRAGEAGNATKMAAAAHSLKGAASNVGATEMQHICAAIERVDPAADADGFHMLYQQLHSELERVRLFVDNHLSGH